jgi:hypothetical protein
MLLLLLPLLLLLLLLMMMMMLMMMSMMTRSMTRKMTRLIKMMMTMMTRHVGSRSPWPGKADESGRLWNTGLIVTEYRRSGQHDNTAKHSDDHIAT